MARTFGAVGKKTKALAEELALQFPGINPVTVMMEGGLFGQLPTYARNEETGEIYRIASALLDTDQRKDLLKESAQYIAPKLKSIEHSGEIDTGASTQIILPGCAPDLATWNRLVLDNASACAQAPISEALEAQEPEGEPEA